MRRRLIFIAAFWEVDGGLLGEPTVRGFTGGGSGHVDRAAISLALADCAVKIERLGDAQLPDTSFPFIRGTGASYGSSFVTLLIEALMPPESAVKTATAPIVITARTTPYSAIV